LHGHVKVAPDGTVYVPNFSCNADGQQSVVVSVDDGLTWKVRALPEAPYNGFKSDPTVGIGADGTVYYAYEGVDGPLRVAVSRDKGVTWTKPVDLTGLAGLAYGVMPAAVAGDGDRAAVAFIGTADTGTSDDMYEDKDYKGVWHLYVAMTYDRGATWEVVNTTPADPVQRGCIWWGNGTCPSVQRNLLDFIDAQIDSSGRVVVAYADGCIGACVNKAPNTAEDIATIARQSAGRTLFAAKDPPPPTP
jgi:hypothetical protein